MIYTLRHETRYHYAKPVDLAAHLLHLTPLTLPWQRVIETSLTSDPPPSRLRSTADCFGNTASWLFLDSPHDRFAAVLEATVEVEAAPAPDTTPPWEQVVRAAAGSTGFAAAEFAYASPMIIPFAAARAYVEPSVPAGQPIFAALLDLTLRF